MQSWRGAPGSPGWGLERRMRRPKPPPPNHHHLGAEGQASPSLVSSPPPIARGSLARPPLLPRWWPNFSGMGTSTGEEGQPRPGPHPTAADRESSGPIVIPFTHTRRGRANFSSHLPAQTLPDCPTPARGVFLPRSAFWALPRYPSPVGLRSCPPTPAPL